MYVLMYYIYVCVNVLGMYLRMYWYTMYVSTVCINVLGMYLCMYWYTTYVSTVCINVLGLYIYVCTDVQCMHPCINVIGRYPCMYWCTTYVCMCCMFASYYSKHKQRFSPNSINQPDGLWCSSSRSVFTVRPTHISKAINCTAEG